MTHGRSRVPAAVKLFPGLVREEFSLVTELLKCMYNNVNIIKDGQLGPDRQFSKLVEAFIQKCHCAVFFSNKI